MKIKLKTNKLKGGKLSYYVEYYFGYRVVDGKNIADRKKEVLKLYLHANPKTPVEREDNRRVKEIAEQIFLIKKSEALSSDHNTYNPYKASQSIIEYFEGRKGSKWTGLKKHLTGFCKKNSTNHLRFKDINESFIKRFKEYLGSEPAFKNRTTLKKNSQSLYFAAFKQVLKEAKEEKIISHNPAAEIKGIKPQETFRNHLEVDEIKKLTKTECDDPLLKKAFLFSCLTGLRWGDIASIKWKNIVFSEGYYKIIFRQEKTEGVEYLYILNQAIKYLPDKSDNPEDLIFEGLEYSLYTNLDIKVWMIRAGITKDITFHCGRHSFANLMLSLGVDIRIIQKMLGHKKLSTTMIYTKVVDKVVKDAIRRMSEIKL